MPNGIIIIDKPAGWTSMDVCAKLRGILHEKRVGHAGTLDPMATGVLPVFVGQATKAVSFAEGGKKVYEAVLLLGRVTDTQDTTGETLEERAVTVTEDEVRAALPRFLGEIEQIPPMYSAIKVNGQKLYDLARQGKEVARKPRRITIYDLALTEELGNGQYALRVECSKGTYIRTLCHDLGQALGCGGCMAALRRTEASGFCIGEAVTLEDAAREGEALLRPLDSLFRAYPAFTIPNATLEKKCLCGNPLRVSLADGIYRVYGCDGTFLALSEARAGLLTSKRNFFSV
ncbi:MAG: tRNA pseudouridine(55) synthase TruB [Oscillospiraceae bacterium]